MTGVCGFILAGGKSSRMGEEKARLEVGGKSLLEIAREKLQEVSDKVLVVGARSKFGEQAVEDVLPDRGPLGGIHAALRASQCELNLILAVDLPFVEPVFLRYLVHEAEHFEAVVTVPRTKDGWQPLCAVYRREFGEVAELALRQGRNKIDALFCQVQLRIIDEDEMQKASFKAGQFRNVNTPADFEHAQAEFAAQQKASSKS